MTADVWCYLAIRDAIFAGKEQTRFDAATVGVMEISAEIQSRVLTRGASSEQYRLYRAGLEWDLADPIVIQDAGDLKSKRLWKDRVIPFHHQVTNLITFCRRLPVTLLADDVGLGKTISAGLIMSELISRARLSKVLIVCPKLLGPQWKDELLTKFDISAEIAIGRDLLSADPEEPGAIITTYNSARLYLESIPEDRFQMLILDEAHKLRNLYGTDSAPKVATVFRGALEKRRFRFVLMLTATPIQNRLWDLYSLVDLLTVARGHENPFGSTGVFARRFIADKKENARQLKAEAKDEFRSIVYGYMSRVRRGDAKLYFPDRVVQMHRVNPTPAELELIGVIAKPIQRLNRLAQISILQALTSSPDALSAQLTNMARNGTVPPELASTVKGIVSRMPISAKLTGLEALITKLKRENPEKWRLVVFTSRRETQTTIQTFLEAHDLKVGLINGESGTRNQETIARFRQNPPIYRVIVSTEAGSEGLNLQVANVLVNFDLPWNPMIVEQRIGRIQRLASEHAHVSIFNIMLRGTFEEYIVGRLMEKLQMASHAIGDIESLLQGASVGDGEEEDSASKFGEQILELILAALAGKDVSRETQLKEQSIEAARRELEQSEAAINDMLGQSDGLDYVGPRAPKLPPHPHTMEPREFVLMALRDLGARVAPYRADDIYAAEENGGREFIRFTQEGPFDIKTVPYAPGSSGFQRVVRRMTATGIHDIEDADNDLARQNETVARAWSEGFGAEVRSIEIREARRRFEGKALLRVRVTVAHDGYERLVEVDCAPTIHCVAGAKNQISPLLKTMEDPLEVGLNREALVEAAKRDESIVEFARFYLERREQEARQGGGDERKRKKLIEDFTPRYQIELVGLHWLVRREVKSTVRFAFDHPSVYESTLRTIPSKGSIEAEPEQGLCSVTGRSVPHDCLDRCEISGKLALRHLLFQSSLSGRRALMEYAATCSLSGKQVLRDEIELSSITQKPCAIVLLKMSAVSGRRGEPEFFGRCVFTGADVLTDELAVSEVSGKRFRSDQQQRSAVSGKAGHQSEFVECAETRTPVAITEAERCEVTGLSVRPGVLMTCEKTGKRAMPSELAKCSATGKRMLKSLLVISSVSRSSVLREIAILSSTGQYCLPAERRVCVWSGQLYHPADLQECALTGLPICSAYATNKGVTMLQSLKDLLDGVRRTEDEMGLWDDIATRVASLQGGKIRIEAAVKSIDSQHLAISCESKTLFGLRSSIVGALCNLHDNTIVGKLAVGKRERNVWFRRR